MTEHVLKIQPKPYRDLESGVKTGEVRNCADRDFKVGDGVRLMMIDETGNPTGNEMHRQITHIQTGYGLPDEICVLSYGKPLLHPIQQTLRDNGDLIALRATVAQQAQMIEHLRGGPTPLFTAVDMGTASADGRRSLAEHLIKQIAIEHPDQDTLLTVGHIAQWIALEAGL